MKLGSSGNLNHPTGDSPPDDDRSDEAIDSCREWVKHKDGMEELEVYLLSEFDIHKHQIEEIVLYSENSLYTK